jgi:hypothetical protein
MDGTSSEHMDNCNSKGSDSTDEVGTKADRVQNKPAEYFDEQAREFVSRLLSLRSLLPALPAVLEVIDAQTKQKLREVGQQYGTVEDNNSKSSISVPGNHQHRVTRHLEALERSAVVQRILPHTFLIALVSQFDVFIGRMIRGIFIAKPESLNASDKSFTISDLLTFASIESAKEYIIEKEVESVLRESHTYHFDWMEKRLGITLRKDLAVWPEFIEITERRNLFVHTDGNVSSQYLEVCGKANVDCGNTVAVGDTLTCTPEYFARAAEVLLELAVKLATVVRCKLIQDDVEGCYYSLNDVAVDLLKEGTNQLACELLEFPFRLPKKPKGTVELYLKVNLGQVYKRLGKVKDFHSVVDEVAWDTLNPTYRLAQAVLLEEYATAAKLMEEIGPEGEIEASDYAHWPLFLEFRKTREFNSAYKRVFGAEFSVRVDKESRASTSSDSKETSEDAHINEGHEAP